MPDSGPRTPTDCEMVTIVEMHCRKLTNTALGALLKSYNGDVYSNILTEINRTIDHIEQSADKGARRPCPDGTDECEPGICCPIFT